MNLSTSYSAKSRHSLASRNSLCGNIPLRHCRPGVTALNTDERRILNQGNPQNVQFGAAVFGNIRPHRGNANSSYNCLQVLASRGPVIHNVLHARVPYGDLEEEKRPVASWLVNRPKVDEAVLSTYWLYRFNP